MEYTKKIGEAVEHMKAGGAAQRKGWHGKGMFVFVEKAHGKQFMTLSLPSGEMQPGWNASTSDLLGEDWGLLGEKHNG